VRLRGARGFTLVEAMIVIAIIGIMSGFAAPSLLGSLPGMRASGAAREVLSDLRSARTLAIKAGCPVVVKFTASPGGYVVALDRDLDHDVSAGDEVKKTVVLTDQYNGVEFNTNVGTVGTKPFALGTGVANAVTFRTNGSASETGEVYLMPSQDVSGTDTKRNRRILIAGSTGNIRIENHNGTDWE
jgi:prepilin-type N-terminal cleavage/methylation domain-containing protein